MPNTEKATCTKEIKCTFENGCIDLKDLDMEFEIFDVSYAKGDFGTHTAGQFIGERIKPNKSKGYEMDVNSMPGVSANANFYIYFPSVKDVLMIRINMRDAQSKLDRDLKIQYAGESNTYLYTAHENSGDSKMKVTFKFNQTQK